MKEDNENRFCVYSLTNPIDNNVFYIGEGITNTRPYVHWDSFIRYKVKNYRNKKFNRDVRGNIDKYEEFLMIYNAGLSPIIKIIISNLTKERACKIQDLLINRYGCRWNNTGILTNFQTISKFPSSMTCQETKDKISRGTKGLKKSKEHRKNLSLANKGKPSSLKNKIKITNEIIERYISTNEEIPIGFRKGSKINSKVRTRKVNNKWRTGTKYITNGVIDKFVIVKRGFKLPIGFKFGRTNGKAYSSLIKS